MSPRHPPRPNEPLTPEERSWAEHLSRIGPQAGGDGGPPAALDTRILAAAHAAVVAPVAGARQSRRPRRGWPTAVGAAASLVIVVGLAWQLRPLLRSRPPLAEAPVTAVATPESEGSLSAEVLAPAIPTAREPVASPPPAQPIAPSRARPTPKAAPPITPPAPAGETRTKVPPDQQGQFVDDAVPPYHAAAAQAESGSQAQARQHSSDNAAGRAARENIAADAAAQAFPAAPPPPAPPPAPVAAAVPSPAPASSPALATRKADDATLAAPAASVPPVLPPVAGDTVLPPADWVQRIRLRRDSGDTDGARASLALFRDHYPRLALPADLRRLER